MYGGNSCTYLYSMKKQVLIFWTPRILSMLSIAFISLFALDSFEKDSSFIENIRHLLLHLIPSFGMLLLLILAWKKELLGGILLTAVALVLAVPVFLLNLERSGSLTVAFQVILLIFLPFIISGLLFIYSHYVKRKVLKPGS